MTFISDMNMKKTIAMILAGVWMATATIAVAGAEEKKEEKEKKEKEPDFPKFEEVTKDMEVKDGLFTLYYDKKKDTLLGRIPKDMLNEPFLIGYSIAKGPRYAGFMVGSHAVYWDRMDKKLVLMAADTRHKREKGTTVEDVINRTYTDSIIMALDIKTEKDGKVTNTLTKIE